MATCTYNMPKLLHKPCLHVYKACAQMRQMCTPYISEYYDMQHLLGTWSAEFHSYGVKMKYTDLWLDMAQWGPNKDLKTTTKGRWQTRRFQNNMDASQCTSISCTSKCRICKTPGHSAKDCHKRFVNRIIGDILHITDGSWWKPSVIVGLHRRFIQKKTVCDSSSYQTKFFLIFG